MKNYFVKLDNIYFASCLTDILIKSQTERTVYRLKIKSKMTYNWYCLYDKVIMAKFIRSSTNIMPINWLVKISNLQFLFYKKKAISNPNFGNTCYYILYSDQILVKP